MKEQSHEIISVYEVVGRVLEKYSPKELKAELSDLINKRDENKKKEYIDFVINSVCDKFLITRNILLRSAKRGDVQTAKQITYCLLHVELNLPMRFISSRVFLKRPHNSVGIAVKRYYSLNNKIKVDREFFETYTEIQSRLAEFIKSKKQ